MSLPRGNVWKVKSGLTVGLYPDAHCHPGHNQKAVIAVARWFRDIGVDIVVNIGDFNDMGSLSSYDKGTKIIEGKRGKKGPRL